MLCFYINSALVYAVSPITMYFLRMKLWSSSLKIGRHPQTTALDWSNTSNFYVYNFDFKILDEIPDPTKLLGGKKEQVLFTKFRFWIQLWSGLPKKSCNQAARKVMWSGGIACFNDEWFVRFCRRHLPSRVVPISD